MFVLDISKKRQKINNYKIKYNNKQRNVFFSLIGHKETNSSILSTEQHTRIYYK